MAEARPPARGGWQVWAAEARAGLRAANRLREVRTFDARGRAGVLAGVGTVVDFASNDYLGLTVHPAVCEAARAAVTRWGAGAGSARLVTGDRPVHEELEKALAEWRGCERALVFSTGYMANVGVLSALGTKDAYLISDELNHASIVDGCRLAHAGVGVHRHGDLDEARMLARRARQEGLRPLVVSDTVFSMDGDVADVAGLADLARGTGALLVLDEAHAVLGPHPELDADGRLEGADCLRVGTLSKTLGSLGGFVAGASEMVELVLNRARSFVFTTAPTPADAAAAVAALSVLSSPDGAARISRLRALTSRVAVAVGLGADHPSPIVPVVLGDEAAALKGSQALADRGLFVPAIRPPSVPAGTSRLRITLSAAHSDADVERLCAALGELGLHAGT